MQSGLILPPGYRPALAVLEMELAIKFIKDFFERHLAQALGLTRVTAPLFVRAGTGVNDDLNGVERPVRFEAKDNPGVQLEIVQSLAKWKRMALARLGISAGCGIYTDMNAIRPDETLDNLHSIYVDQWDWEQTLTAADRDVETLKATVRKIYAVLRQTEQHVAERYPQIEPVLPTELTFVSSDELLRRYPELTPAEREHRVCRDHGAVFVLGIGAPLGDGQPHDGRAPDYDDWSTVRPDGGRGLNGDILLWNPVLGRNFEISSMGVRVDAAALRYQLGVRGLESRLNLDFHRALVEGRLPESMGGGIGQSRLCMFFLRTAHVGEVAVGAWPPAMHAACAAANIFLR